MKKTVRVSLSGFSYNLEEDAYRLLDHYLEEIRVRLGSNADAEETLRDIEERISELLTARMGQRETVPAGMVQDIINQIGMPEEVTGNAEYSKDQWETQPPKKRLYRDTENPVIAGVCSGVAAFFGVDPIVIRIIFIALMFARGFGLLLYIILWIVVPRALTPKQKLEMRGQPVTLSNMGKNISEEMSSVKSSVSQKVPRNFFERLGKFLGQVGFWLLKFIMVLVKVVAIAIGIVLIVSMLFAFIVLVGAFFFSGITLPWLFPGTVVSSLNEFITSMIDISSGLWITIPTFLILAIPIVALIYIGIRVLFRFKARDGKIAIIATGIWVASVLTLAISIFIQLRSLSFSGADRQVVQLSSQLPRNQQTIYLKAFPQYDEATLPSVYKFFDYSITTVQGEKVISGQPKLVIEKSDSDSISLILSKNARGFSSTNAAKNAADIIYPYSVKDSTIFVDSRFTLPASVTWKGQTLTLSLLLPEGYSIYLDSSICGILDTDQPYSSHWPDEMVGQTWTMTRNGLRVKR